MANQILFHALSDPTRRQVLEALSGGPQAVSTLAENLPVSRSAVSQHLKVLSDAGLVAAETEGRMRIYHVRRQGIAELRSYLDQFWGEVLDSFAEEMRSETGKFQ